MTVWTIKPKDRFRRLPIREISESQSFWAWFVNVVILAIGLINSVLLARSLGPDGRGQIAAIILWPAVLVFLSSFGLFESILYHAARPGASLGRLWTTSSVFAIGQSMVAMAVGFVLLPMLLHSQQRGVIAASRAYLFVIPLGLMTQYNVSIIQGVLHMKTVNILRTIIPAGYLVGTIALDLLSRIEPIRIMYLLLVLNLTTMICSALNLPWHEMRGDLSFDLAIGRETSRYGAKVFLGTITNFANLRLDQVLIAAWLPATQLGLYVAAVTASGLLGTASQAVIQVMTPTIARQSSVSRGREILLATFHRFWLLGIVVTPVFALLNVWLIPTIYGRAFTGSIWPAQVLLVATLFLCLRTVLSGGALALGDPWLTSKSELIASIVTFVFLPTLVPLIGISGAAIASLLSYLASYVMLIRGLRNRHALQLGFWPSGATLIQSARIGNRMAREEPKGEKAQSHL